MRRKKKPKKVGMFNRFDYECRRYIQWRAKQLGISQVTFIQNSVGLAGPDMPEKFKFPFTYGIKSHS